MPMNRRDRLLEPGTSVNPPYDATPPLPIQRKDEHVTEVIGHSSHVTVYALDVSTKAWVRGCQGGGGARCLFP